MRRLHATLAGLVVVAACSSEPMLATDFTDSTSTTTTTSTTTSTSTSTPTAIITTSTVEDGPDPSDLLRLAYDDLIAADALSFVSYVDSDTDLIGRSRTTQVGQWNNDDRSLLRVAVSTDAPTVSLDELVARQTSSDDTISALDDLGEGSSYRFAGDDLWWSMPADTSTWSGAPLSDEVGTELEMASDAATFLDPLFTAIIEVTTDPGIDDAGSTIYSMELAADSIVPFMASDPLAQTLFDLGWNGMSDATTLGSMTLSADGRLVAATVDQTPWWQAGFDAVGVVDDRVSVRWAITLAASDTLFDIEAPCDGVLICAG